MSNNRFPQYLSSPVQVLWFELDEVGLIFTCLSLALVFGGWFWWLSVIVIPWIYRIFKSRHPKGFANNLIYLFGLKELPHYPGAFQNRYEE